MGVKRVKLMRGVEAERFFATPVQGEPIMTTDELKLYLGDGNKAGGFVVNADSTIAVWPDQTDATKKLSLAWWIAYFNGAEATVRIPRGTHEVLYDMTIPKNLCLHFDKGATLKVADTKTLTFNGSIEAGLWQIFSGTGYMAGRTFNECVYPEWFGAKGDGNTDDTDAIQKAMNYHPIVCLSNHKYMVRNLSWPRTLQVLRSNGTKNTATLEHIAGSSGILLGITTGERVNNASIENLYLVGNGEEGETNALDFSGFSYSSFFNVQIRFFNGSGFYGHSTYSPTTMQTTNNTFVHCNGNNNKQHGIDVIAINACTFLGCEFSRNTLNGVNLQSGNANFFYGCCLQGNSGYGFYCNGSNVEATFYGESGVKKEVFLDENSAYCSVKSRRSYPLGFCVVDKGKYNDVSSLGQVSVAKNFFSNPFFYNWVEALPVNTAKYGTPVFSVVDDIGNPNGKSLSIDFTAKYQAIDFYLDNKIQFNGRRVTLLLEMDTSLLPDSYYIFDRPTRIQTDNVIDGRYFVGTLRKTDGYELFYFDVAFSDSDIDTPVIRFTLNYYFAVSEACKVKIRSAYVLDGCVAKYSETPQLPGIVTATTSNLENASYGVNLMLKKEGSLVFNSTDKNFYYSAGSDSISIWTRVGSTETITPA